MVTFAVVATALAVTLRRRGETWFSAIIGALTLTVFIGSGGGW